MPHCVIEYSNNLLDKINVKDILFLMNQILEDSSLFKPNKIKLRAIGYDDFLIPNIYKSFIHLKLHLLAGRSNEQKNNLAKELQEKLLMIINNQEVSITAEIIEIDAASYQQTN
jgi:5-carboxymethyl-2-hydroxymuconate isomerase